MSISTCSNQIFPTKQTAFQQPLGKAWRMHQPECRSAFGSPSAAGADWPARCSWQQLLLEMMQADHMLESSWIMMNYPWIIQNSPWIIILWKDRSYTSFRVRCVGRSVDRFSWGPRVSSQRALVRMWTGELATKRSSSAPGRFWALDFPHSFTAPNTWNYGRWIGASSRSFTLFLGDKAREVSRW